MNHYELLAMKVSIKEALDSNEFTLSLGSEEIPTNAINGLLKSSANSLDSHLLDADKSKDIKIDEDKKTGLLTLNIDKVAQG